LRYTFRANEGERHLWKNIKGTAMDKEELFEAAEKGNRSKVKALLEMGVDVNARDIIGQSALSRALFARHNGIAGILLDKGANVNAKDDCGGTALHKACYLGRYDVVKLLLENKADVNVKDEHGNTALTIASETDDSSIIKILLKSKAGST